MKDLTDIIRETELNQISLYQQAMKSGLVNEGRVGDICWYKAEKGGWPNKISLSSDNVSPEHIEQADHEVVKKNAPPYWIFRSDDSRRHVSSALLNKGYRQVDQWKGMYLDLRQIQDNSFDPKLVIRPVQESAGLHEWMTIINKVLFKQQPVNERITGSFIKNNKIEMLTGYLKNNPVSALLIHFKGEYAGVYMVATHQNFQRQGFGQQMMQKTLQVARQQGSKFCILHATSQGLKLYQKLGFIEICVFDLFWKVGKSYI
jgi:ribosomal protein S18 acetylase RimI-like enzyme